MERIDRTKLITSSAIGLDPVKCLEVSEQSLLRALLASKVTLEMESHFSSVILQISYFLTCAGPL